MISISRNYQMVFCTILNCSNSVGFQFLLILVNTCYCFLYFRQPNGTKKPLDESESGE